MYDITLRHFDVEYLDNLQNSRPEEPCPIFSPHTLPDENVVYIRRDEMEIHFREPLIPIVKHFPTYLIWTSDIHKVLGTTESTCLVQLRMRCG